MKLHVGQFALSLLLIITVGCETVPAPQTADEAISRGRPSIDVVINSPIPGAYVLTEQGNRVGDCPANFKVTFDSIGYPDGDGARWFSPYGQMVARSKGTGRLYHWGPIPGVMSSRADEFYLVGEVVAPGYNSRPIRELLASSVDGVSRNRIMINAQLMAQRPVTPPVAAPQQQQQQQQQQQTVIVGESAPDEKPGKVLVSCSTDDAEVLVDGMFVGTTPATLTLKPGIHVIEIKKPGFRSYKREIRVFAESEVPLRATLEPE